MSGYQRFICLGNLTKDAESRMAGENEVAKFGLAVNGYKDSVEYFDCEMWKPGGVVEYLVRGTQVLVEGEIQTQSWEKDGEKKSKKIIKVMKVQLCGGKRREEPALEEAFSDFR